MAGGCVDGRQRVDPTAIHQSLAEHGVAVVGLVILRKIAEAADQADPDDGVTIRGATLYDILVWLRAYEEAVEAEPDA
jgi:hypothetical protein